VETEPQIVVLAIFDQSIVSSFWYLIYKYFVIRKKLQLNKAEDMINAHIIRPNIQPSLFFCIFPNKTGNAVTIYYSNPFFKFNKLWDFRVYIKNKNST